MSIGDLIVEDIIKGWNRLVLLMNLYCIEEESIRFNKLIAKDCE